MRATTTAMLALLGIATACADSDSRPAALSAPQTIGIDVREDLTLAAATSADAVLRDFNNDGIQDLAVTTYEGTVEIRLGRPQGSFAGPIVVELPGKLAALAAGDLDNDHDIDLIVLRQDKQLVTSLVNDGRGGFHIAANAATPPEPVDVLLCQAMGDANLDLVVSALGSPELGVCPGKGDCSFHVPTMLPIPPGVNMVATVAGDLTGDGRDDLVVVDSDGDMIWLYPGSAMGFAPYHGFAVGDAPVAAAIGDVNRDGRADLLVANLGDRSVSVMLCNGELPELFTTHVLPVEGAPGRLAVGDVTGDGFADLAVPLFGEFAISLFPGRADGTLDRQVQLVAGGMPTRLMIGDVDRDGRTDLLATGGTFGKIGIWRARPPFGLTGALAHPTGLGEAPFVAVADYDADGRSEIAVAGAHSHLVALLRMVDETKPFPRLESIAQIDVGRPVFQLTKGDLNHDGKLDLLVSGVGGLRVLANRSTPGAPAFEVLPVQPPGVLFPATAPFEVVPIDLEGDGRLDLVVADSGADQVLVLRSLNDWFEYDWQAIRLPVDGMPGGLAVADFTGDGYVDIAVSRYEAGRITILANDGYGAFQGLTELPSGAGPIYLRTADFDANGWADLVVSAVNDGEVRVWFSTVNGFRMLALPAGSRPTALLARDFNADGRPDILVGTLSGAEFRLLLGDGRGGFPRVQLLPGSYRAVSAEVADLTGDGKHELIIGSVLQDRLAILRGL